MHKWENRSVSCEVELEAGKRYEVLPKITATRNEGPRAKPPQDIVREYAEKNPQKLRQVGMSYDLAHAKGGVPDEDELLEKKKAELRKKKEDKKKRKQKKKQRKAITKAAKAMEKAADAMKEVVKGDGAEKKAEGGVSATVGVAAPAGQKPEAPSASKPAEAGTGGLKNAPPPPPPAEEAKKATDDEASKDEGPKTEQEKADKNEEAETSKDEKQGEAAEVEETAEEADEEEEDKDDSDKDDKDSDDEDEDGNDEAAITSPWNAVAVLGLRVYAQDPQVTVDLVKVNSADELTTLTVDGKPAGATM